MLVDNFLYALINAGELIRGEETA